MTEDSFQLQAKGARPDEALDIALKLPLLNPELTKTQRAAQPGAAPEGSAGLLKFNLGDFLPKPVLDSDSLESQDSGDLEGGGHFSLRCGQMLVSAEVLPFPLILSCWYYKPIDAGRSRPCQLSKSW